MTRLVIFVLIALCCRPLSAEVFFGSVLFIDAADTGFVCPEGDVCIVPTWNRYAFDGVSIEDGAVVEATVAHLHHHYLTSTQKLLVTVSPVTGESDYASLKADYVVLDIEVSENVLCTDNPTVVSKVKPDVIIESSDRRCFSEERIIESIAE